MRFIANFFIVIACLALTACATPRPELNVQPIPYNETQSAVRAFSDLCIKTLPKFEGFQSLASNQGLSSLKYKGHTFHHHQDTQRIFAMKEKVDGIEACGIAFLGSANLPAVAQKFLSQTKRKTGGAPQREFTDPDVYKAYHLKNNSIYIHLVESSIGDSILHMIVITEPIANPDKVNF